MFSLVFCPKYFLNSLVISSLTHGLLRIVVCNFQVLMIISCILLSLLSDLINYDQVLYSVRVSSKSYDTYFMPYLTVLLVDIPCALENNAYSIIIGC